MSDDIRRDIARNKWQYRAVEATGGNTRLIGSIVLAVLNKNASVKSQRNIFTSPATVTSDGFVMADFIDKDGRKRPGALVCDMEDLITNFRKLADHLKLNDTEREEMFAELRKWIATDYRVNPEYNLN